MHNVKSIEGELIARGARFGIVLAFANETIEARQDDAKACAACDQLPFDRLHVVHNRILIPKNNLNL